MQVPETAGFIAVSGLFRYFALFLLTFKFFNVTMMFERCVYTNYNSDALREEKL